MLKKLTVQLKSGVLSKFDSDTTLGIFCWRLKNLLGKEKLKTFLDFYQKGKPVFTISNELFDVNGTLFFPQPVYVPAIKTQSDSKKEKIGLMLKYKESRSNNFISLRQFNAFLNGNIEEYSKKETDIYVDDKKKVKLTPGYQSELRVGVQINRESGKSQDGQLFSLHPKFMKEGNKLAFLIKVLDKIAFDEFHCEQVLKDVFEIGYGKKKSSGYGHFKDFYIEDYNEIKQPANANGFISLSNYLPAESDAIISGRYDTKVKYGKLGEEFSLSSNPFKQPVLICLPGSTYKTIEKKEWYGRVTSEGEISPSNREIIHFGTAFTLQANLLY